MRSYTSCLVLIITAAGVQSLILLIMDPIPVHEASPCLCGGLPSTYTGAVSVP